MDGTSHITNNNSTIQISSNTIFLKFNNLYGIPLNYLNFGTSSIESFKFPHRTISSVTSDTITIDVEYPAIVDPNISFYSNNDITYFTDQESNIDSIVNSNAGGGIRSYIRKINNIKTGYPDPHLYIYELERPYKNIIQARIVGSVFPNSQRIINNINNDIVNNKLYWRNLDDGNYIYQLCIDPGNYSPNQLKQILEKKFRETIKYSYSKEYLTIHDPSIIEKNTPLNRLLYDENGLYKYHIIDVTISEITDMVTFSSYGEIIQPNSNIYIPSESININITGNLIKNFNPQNDLLFIYLTSDSYYNTNDFFPFINGNLYMYTKKNNIDSSDSIDFVMNLNMNRVILININYDNIQEINSINSEVLLQNFSYNYLIKEVTLMNHNLKIGDLIITDKFNDPKNSNIPSIYEINFIIDPNRFGIMKISYGSKYKIIYKNLAINFDTNNFYYVFSHKIDISDNQLEINPILTITSIISEPDKNNMMVIYHPNNQLEINDTIKISGSYSINNVPATSINGVHTVNKIINTNKYLIYLDKYIPTENNSLYQSNMISIRYPTFFQLLFNYPDTLGNILNFNNVGKPNAITEYNHIIKNTDPYESHSNFASDKNDNGSLIKKLSMVGDDYFYICCPELAHIQNTTPVKNVFAIIRWSENPGNIVIDSYVPTTKIFTSPLASLTELHISCNHPDGRLVNFNGLDHSFVIELTEIYSQPEYTDIYTRMNSVVLTNRVS